MQHCYKCNAPAFDGPTGYSGPMCKCFTFTARNLTGAAPAPWVPYREQELVPSAELAALRKDAERYRYYRARAYKDGSTLAIDVGVIDDVAVGDFGEFIDATADAAIAAAR